MKLESIIESRWVEVTGGANSSVPGYEWPWSHPHVIHDKPSGEWYHGTSDIYLDSIRENGLNNLYVTNTNNTKNHITKNRSLARFSARRRAAIAGGSPIIIMIDGSKLPTDIVGSSLDSCTGLIPPDAIIKISKVRQAKES